MVCVQRLVENVLDATTGRIEVRGGQHGGLLLGLVAIVLLFEE